MTTQPQARDAMQFINEQDPATIERFVARLELRGKDPTFVAYRDNYLDAMDMPPLTASTGQLPVAQVEAWLADQRRSASDGTFFAACNYYAYVARL